MHAQKQAPLFPIQKCSRSLETVHVLVAGALPTAVVISIATRLGELLGRRQLALTLHAVSRVSLPPGMRRIGEIQLWTRGVTGPGLFHFIIVRKRSFEKEMPLYP